jgi:hypothetical protein
VRDFMNGHTTETRQHPGDRQHGFGIERAHYADRQT